MKEKIKKYALLIKKHGFDAIKIISIIVFYISFFYHPKFRTFGYSIHSYSYILFIFMLPFWFGYLIYKILFPKGKTNVLSKIIRLAIAGPLILGLIYLTIYCFLRGYIDYGYEECMEWCVKDDLSNYNECSSNTCDSPI